MEKELQKRQVKEELGNKWCNTKWKRFGKTITTKEVQDYIDDNNIRPIVIEVSKISHLNIFRNKLVRGDLFTSNHEYRIENADLSYPIYLLKKGGTFYKILDGNHRITKAIRYNVQFIKAYVLNLDIINNKLKLL